MTADRPPSHDDRFPLSEEDVTVQDPSLESEADAPAPPSDPAGPDRPRDRGTSSEDRGGLDRFESGDRIGHFDIQEEVGRGGMGVVYRAWDRRLEREVALKFLPAHLVANPESKERFLREARAASALDHPHVATVHEIGETARGEPFLVMSYYAGHSLEEQLRRGPLPVDTALGYAEQIADALEAAHSRGLLHRDIKPSNILLSEAGPIKLLDFGLARWMSDSGITQPGRILGTVSYMSPEQLQGEELDGRSDLWALGVVLYEMLSGTRPFVAPYEHALMYAITHEEPPALQPLRPEVSEEVADLVCRCLAKDPNDRYESARQLLGDIRRAHASLDPTHTKIFPASPSRIADDGPYSPVEDHASVSGRAPTWRWMVRAGVATAALVGAFLAWFLLLGEFPVRQDGRAPLVAPGSRIAVLAISGPSDPNGAPTASLLDELAISITHLLTRIDPVTDLGLQIVPSSELGDVRTVQAARAGFGVEYVLTLARLNGPENTRLSLNLIDARNLDQLRSVAVPLPETDETTDSETAADRLGRAVARLIGLPSTTALDQILSVGGMGIDPTARRYYELGRNHLADAADVSDLKAAAQLFQWALRAQESYPEAFAGLAESYDRLFQRTGDSTHRQTATMYARRAEAGSSPRPTLHISRGLLAESRGSYEKALLDFKIAAALDSTRVDARRGMGRAYESLGRHEEAEQAFRRAIELDPKGRLAYEDFGRFLFLRGRFDEAQEAYRSLTRLAPTSGAQGQVRVGTQHYVRGDLEEARSAYEEALRHPQLDPRYRLAALSNLGTVHYYDGRLDQAVDAYRRALSIDSTSHLLWGNLASALQQTETRAPNGSAEALVAYRRADRLAERSLAVNPHQPAVLIARATYQYELGFEDRARPLLERAIEADPRQVIVRFHAGHLLEQLGERPRAGRLLREAIEAGYPPRWVVERDPELEAIRQDPVYNPLLPSPQPASRPVRSANGSG